LDSNEIDESDLHHEKQKEPNVEQWKESKLIEVMNYEMHMLQFVSIVNWIQMKLMKVIYTMKNRKNQKFEQWKEL
jgi:hypothetical protein